MAMHARSSTTPWFLWPFAAAWKLLGLLLGLTGRLVAGVLGFVSMAIGTILTLTILGAPIGIPLVLLGFMLVIRSLF